MDDVRLQMHHQDSLVYEQSSSRTDAEELSLRDDVLSELRRLELHHQAGELDACEKTMSVHGHRRSCGFRLICPHCSEVFANKTGNSIRTTVEDLQQRQKKNLYDLDGLRILFGYANEFVPQGSNMLSSLRSAASILPPQQIQTLRSAAHAIEQPAATLQILDAHKSILQSYIPQAVTLNRLTYRDTKEDPTAYREAAYDALECAKEVLQPTLKFPGAGAITALHLQKNIHTHCTVFGPPVDPDQLAADWLERTGDSDQVHVKPLETAEDVFYWTRYLFNIPKHVPAADLVSRWRAAPSRTFRTYGSFYGQRL
jgi:hypothetical protein